MLLTQKNEMPFNSELLDYLIKSRNLINMKSHSFEVKTRGCGKGCAGCAVAHPENPMGVQNTYFAHPASM